VQHGVDGGRVGVEVQHGPHPGDDLWQQGVEAVAGLQQHPVACGIEARTEPAGGLLPPARRRTVRRSTMASPGWAHSTPSNWRCAKKVSSAATSKGGR